MRLGEVVFAFPEPRARRRARVVGILNVTPDSFSDGGLFESAGAAIERGLEMIAAGADIIDVGGESTRPGATAVAASEEIARILPVVEGLARRGAVVSIDTTKAAVASSAIAAGALLVNDISGGRFDPDIVRITADSRAGFVLGHIRGSDLAAVHAEKDPPATAAEVERELAASLEALPPSLRGRVICDPGLGFGKPCSLNLELTQNAGALARTLQCPIMLGPSRKRFLGEITGKPAARRDAATIGAALAAVACGAHFVRVHEVGAVVDALRVFEAALFAGHGERA